MTKNNYKGTIFLIFASFIDASLNLMVRLLDGGFSVFWQIFLRNLIIFIFAGIFLLIVHRTNSFAKIYRTNWQQILIFAVFSAVSIFFSTLSILSIKLFAAIFALFVGSILGSYLIGYLFLNEKPTYQDLLEIILVVIALLVFNEVSIFDLDSIKKLDFFDLGFMLGLVGGFADALVNSTRKHLSKSFTSIELVPFSSFGVVITSIIFLFGKTLFDTSVDLTLNPSIIQVVILLLFGGGIVFLQSLLTIGFKHIHLGIGSIILSSQLVFASLLGFLVLGEGVSFNEIIGTILIVASIIISAIER